MIMIMFKDFIDRLRNEVDMTSPRNRDKPFFILEFTSEVGDAYSPLSVVAFGEDDRHYRDCLMFHYMNRDKSKFGNPQPFVYENTWQVVAVKRPKSTNHNMRIQIARRTR